MRISRKEFGVEKGRAPVSSCCLVVAHFLEEEGPWATESARAHGRSREKSAVMETNYRRLSLFLPLGRVITAVFTIPWLVFQIIAEHNYQMDTNALLQILSDPAKMQWLFLLMLWTIPWKGVALWRSARNKQMPWFIGIMVVNTFGILEILYLAFFQKPGEEK